MLRLTLLITVCWARLRDPASQVGGIWAARPLCSPDGWCFENATQSSPRTAHSSHTRRDYELWWGALDSVVKAAAAAAAAREPPRVWLVGDSITERLNGMRYGVAMHDEAAARGLKAARAPLDELSGATPPAVLAISGDQTQHVLYWLDRLERRPDADRLARVRGVVVLLIGTNNLGSGHLPSDAVAGIAAVAARLARLLPAVRVLVSTLLPRGGPDNMRTRLVCPPRCAPDGEPFAGFQPAVRTVNSALPSALAAHADVRDRITIVDCSALFLLDSAGAAEFNVKLMPDGLHPSAEGAALWVKCLAPSVARELAKLGET